MNSCESNENSKEDVSPNADSSIAGSHSQVEFFAYPFIPGDWLNAKLAS